MSPLLPVVLTLFSAADARPKLLVLETARGADIEAQVAASLNTALARELQRRGVFEVLTSSELVTVLGVERQKQLLGCTETSCLTELSGAMGANFVMSSTLTKLGTAFSLTVQVTDTSSAKTVGRAVRIASALEDYVPALPWVVAEAAGLPAPESPNRALPGAIIGVGSAAIIGGGVVGLLSLLKARDLNQELSIGGATSGVLKTQGFYDQQGQALAAQNTASVVTMAAGAALVVVGAVIWAKQSSPGSPSVALVVDGHRAAFAFGASF